MSGLLILRALLFAAECFLASALLPVFAFAVSALLRRRAALRHLVFTTMFGVLALLPVMALLLPPRRIVEHVAAPSAADTLMVAAPVVTAPPPPSLLTPENIVLLLVALWLAGLFWQLLRLGVGGLGLMRLRRRSAPFAVELETGCAVRLSDGENGPSTFGIVRPIVLLPRSAQAWPLARLDAVLRHEAAHVARRDALSQFIARLVCAVFWPNPLLWLAARAQRREAEIAADDAVLASGMTPSLYAAELVSLAAQARGLQPGIAMAAPPLSERVQSVLANNSSRKGVTKMDMVKTGTLGLTAALLLGVARFDIAVAQDAAPPARPAAATIGPVAADPAEAAAIKAQIGAQAEATKARADAVTAKAMAKAAAETDPAKKAQYAQEAAQVAAESARVKAQADRIGDRSLSAAQRAASARALSADALAKAQSVLAQQTEILKQEGADAAKQQLSQMSLDAVGRARAAMAQAQLGAADAERRMELAQAATPSRAQSSASQSADSTVSTDGVTITTGRGVSQNSDSNSDTNNGLTIFRPGVTVKAPLSLTIVPSPPAVTFKAPVNVTGRIVGSDAAGNISGNNVTITGRPGVNLPIIVRPQIAVGAPNVHVTTVSEAMINNAVNEAMNRPEVRAAISAAVRTALAQAGSIEVTKVGVPARLAAPPVRPALPVPPAPAPSR